MRGVFPTKDRSFVTLDGLRGIAAIAVIPRHATVYFESISVNVQLPGINAPVLVGPFFESYLAVDFFFALSGFVLSHAYGRRLREGMSASQFMKARIIRLYPLYFLALAIAIPLEWRNLARFNQGYSSLAIDTLTAIFFLPSFTAASLFPLNVPAWSLFFELVANASWCLMARHISNIKLSVIVAVAAIALLVMVQFKMFGFGSAGIGAMADGFQWRAFGAGFIRVIFSFFAGVLIYRIWCVWRPPLSVPPLIVAVALASVLTAHPTEKYQAAFDLVAVIAIFPFIIWIGASSVPGRSIAQIFAWMGAASYAVYVLQHPLSTLTETIVFKAFHGDIHNFNWLWSLAYIAFVFAIAAAADRYFDRPIRSELTSRFLASH